jgi:hypothetical protein
VYGDRTARSVDETAAMTSVWCHDMTSVVTAPHFWEFALALLPQAAAYLGTVPHLYSMNAFWTRASDDLPMRDLQTWHRDYDDEKFLALFVYGTDVMGPDAGPHMFQKGTHESAESGEVEIIYGPAGTAFLADTRGLHVGMKPTSPDPRLILWARYGVSERPRSYDIDELSPVPSALLGDRYPQDVATREIVKLVAA